MSLMFSVVFFLTGLLCFKMVTHHHLYSLLGLHTFKANSLTFHFALPSIFGIIKRMN